MLPTEAWNAAESDLARGLNEEHRAQHSGTLSTADLKRQHELESQRTELQPRILQLVSSQTLSDTQQNELAGLQSRRAAIERELAEFLAILSKQKVASLPAVQSAVPDDAALVLWLDVSGDGGLQEHWACVVRRSGEPAWERLLGTGAEGAWTIADSHLPSEFREAVTSRTLTEAELHELAQVLHSQRFAPLARHLDGVKTLYVVAVNEMAGIPVEVLTDQYTISYVPSGTFLGPSQREGLAHRLGVVGGRRSDFREIGQEAQATRSRFRRVGYLSRWWPPIVLPSQPDSSLATSC